MTEPRRVLIDWDYGASGIWWVLTKQEKEAPAPPGQWTGVPSSGPHSVRPWSDPLTSALLDDLQAWNGEWSDQDPDIRALRARGRDLAVRVQIELGTDGWEVLYQATCLEAELHAPQARLVQPANQHGVLAAWFDIEISERLTADLIQPTPDSDPTAVHTTSAVAFGEYGDRELAQRPLQFPLGNVRSESPGLDAVDVLAGLGQVPGRHVDRGMLGQLGPPAGVLAAGGIHGASED